MTSSSYAFQVTESTREADVTALVYVCTLRPQTWSYYSTKCPKWGQLTETYSRFVECRGGQQEKCVRMWPPDNVFIKTLNWCQSSSDFWSEHKRFVIHGTSVSSLWSRDVTSCLQLKKKTSGLKESKCRHSICWKLFLFLSESPEHPSLTLSRQNEIAFNSKQVTVSIREASLVTRRLPQNNLRTTFR